MARGAVWWSAAERERAEITPHLPLVDNVVWIQPTEPDHNLILQTNSATQSRVILLCLGYHCGSSSSSS